jgi:hypothetical protein
MTLLRKHVLQRRIRVGDDDAPASTLAPAFIQGPHGPQQQPTDCNADHAEGQVDNRSMTTGRIELSQLQDRRIQRQKRVLKAWADTPLESEPHHYCCTKVGQSMFSVTAEGRPRQLVAGKPSKDAKSNDAASECDT